MCSDGKTYDLDFDSSFRLIKKKPEHAQAEPAGGFFAAPGLPRRTRIFKAATGQSRNIMITLKFLSSLMSYFPFALRVIDFVGEGAALVLLLNLVGRATEGF